MLHVHVLAAIMCPPVPLTGILHSNIYRGPKKYQNFENTETPSLFLLL